MGIQNWPSLIVKLFLTVVLDSLFEEVLVNEELCMLALNSVGGRGIFPISSQGWVALVDVGVHAKFPAGDIGCVFDGVDEPAIIAITFFVAVIAAAHCS